MGVSDRTRPERKKNGKKGKQNEEQFTNVCVNTRSKDGTDAVRLTSED